MLHGLIVEMRTTGTAEKLVLFMSTANGFFWKHVLFEIVGGIAYGHVLGVINGASLKWATSRLLAIDAVTRHDFDWLALQSNVN